MKMTKKYFDNFFMENGSVYLELEKCLNSDRDMFELYPIVARIIDHLQLNFWLNSYENIINIMTSQQIGKKLRFFDVVVEYDIELPLNSYNDFVDWCIKTNKLIQSNF